MKVRVFLPVKFGHQLLHFAEDKKAAICSPLWGLAVLRRVDEDVTKDHFSVAYTQGIYIITGQLTVEEPSLALSLLEACLGLRVRVVICYL